jgi:hypothetical protein
MEVSPVAANAVEERQHLDVITQAGRGRGI